MTSKNVTAAPEGILTIGKRRSIIGVSTFAEASQLYCAERDLSGEGGSTFPDGRFILNGTAYRISYNGKVWAGKDWESGDAPVFNPYAAPAPKARKPRAKRYIGEEARSLTRAEVARFESFMDRLNRGEVDLASLVVPPPVRVRS